MPIGDYETIDIDIPDWSGGDSHPFSRGKPTFHKELKDKAEGQTNRTAFFEKTLVGLYWSLDWPVPYAFRTRNGEIRSLDAGCMKFLYNRREPEIELVKDQDGYIIAAKPLEPLLDRYLQIRQRLVRPFPTLLDNMQLHFDLSAPIDERRRVESERVIREGAPAFRQSMIDVWSGRCAVSRTAVLQVLEAAHVYPYMGVKTNDKRNGILLRSDLHTLFDCYLISFCCDGNDLISRGSKTLEATGYANLLGKKLRAPPIGERPARDVIDFHYAEFCRREAQRK